MKKRFTVIMVCIAVMMSLLALTSCGAKEVNEINGIDAEEALEVAITMLAANNDYEVKTDKSVTSAKVWFITVYSDETKTGETLFDSVSDISIILTRNECTITGYEEDGQYYITVENDGYLDYGIDSQVYTVYLDDSGRIEKITRTETMKELLLKMENVLTHNVIYE